MKSIGTRIRHLRLSKDLSQENMAETLKIAKNSYAKIERNEVKHIHEKLEPIANILGIPLIELLFGNDIKFLNNTEGGVKKFFLKLKK